MDISQLVQIVRAGRLPLSIHQRATDSPGVISPVFFTIALSLAFLVVMASVLPGISGRL